MAEFVTDRIPTVTDRIPIRLKIKNPQKHYWMSTTWRPENISQSKPRKISPNISRRRVIASKNISGTKDIIPTILKPSDTIQHLLDMPIFYFESNKYTYAYIIKINNGPSGNITKTDTLDKYIGDNNTILVHLATYVIDPCPICLEPLGKMLEGENRVVASHKDESGEGCKNRHLFHYKCLSRWMKTSKSCPMCRKKINRKPVLSTQCLTSEDVKNVNRYFKF